MLVLNFSKIAFELVPCLPSMSTPSTPSLFVAFWLPTNRWEGTLPANMIAVTTPRELELLSRQAFDAGRAVLINYFQEDCYACRCLHSKLKQMAVENPEVLFLKVNGSNESLRAVFEEQGVMKVRAHALGPGCGPGLASKDERLRTPLHAGVWPHKQRPSSVPRRRVCEAASRV
jgi:hypothetical protein